MTLGMENVRYRIYVWTMLVTTGGQVVSGGRLLEVFIKESENIERVQVFVPRKGILYPADNSCLRGSCLNGVECLHMLGQWLN